jgi:hypothetical protein
VSTTVATWLLARLQKEHRGMVIFYLLFFQCVNPLSGGLIPVLIFMCVLVGVLGPTAHPGLPLKMFLGVGRCRQL